LQEALLKRGLLEELSLGTAAPTTSALRRAVGIHRGFVPDILSVEVLRNLRALVQPRIVSAEVGRAVLT